MTELKAAQSAEHIQNILDRFWKSNAENGRLRAEVAKLQSKVRSLESLNEQTETVPISKVSKS